MPADVDTGALHAIFTQAPDAIVTTDAAGLVTAWNPAAERITGWTAAEVLGKAVGDFHQPGEGWHRKKDGRRYWSSGTILPLRNVCNARDEVCGFVEMFRDATLAREETAAAEFRAQLSEAVRRECDPETFTKTAQAMLGRHLDASRVFFAQLDIETGVSTVRSDWTNGVASVVGVHQLRDYSELRIPEVLAGTAFVFCDVDWDFPPGPQREATRAVGAIASLALPSVVDEKHVTIAIVHQSRPRNWTDGEVALVRQVADIVAVELRRARTVAALHRSESELRQLADALPQMVWAARPDGTVDYYNRRWYEYTGLPRGIIGDPSWVPAIHADDLATTVAVWQDTHRKHGARPIECRLRRADGTYRWHLLRALPVRDADGEIVRWFATSTDMHAQKEARIEAERAGRMKDEFLATLSHELRTPLNAIVGWSAILQRMTNPLTPSDIVNGIDIIARNARAQSQLIEDTLDMSRIVAGNLRLDINVVDVHAAVDAATDTVKAAAEAKEIRLRVVVDAAAGAIAADPNRLQQVLWNLLSNAVKFTPHGGRVELTVQRRGSHIEVSVTDDGEGIRKDFLPFVFDRFRQADGSTTRRHGGLGLGLAIVKQLVELHGGTVAVTSAGLNQGSSFVVSLPLTPVHAAPATDAPEAPGGPASLRGVRVVLVDDEADGRAAVSRLLASEGADVRSASSTEEALALFASAPPDVLLSDLGLPDDDGYSLIRQVRGLSEARGGSVPAAALTTFALDADRRRVLDAGFQVHLAKPIEPAQLIAAVAALSKASARKIAS